MEHSISRSARRRAPQRCRSPKYVESVHPMHASNISWIQNWCCINRRFEYWNHVIFLLYFGWRKLYTMLFLWTSSTFFTDNIIRNYTAFCLHIYKNLTSEKQWKRNEINLHDHTKLHSIFDAYLQEKDVRTAVNDSYIATTNLFFRIILSVRNAVLNFVTQIMITNSGAPVNSV